ncbi:TonB-dependent receptor [Pelagicoccus sp. NFK12]|uniref:TonB-dependent receptor n=1 Tax=Pelagicoccus enzymogenes TaxID=2773457 RepID=A0A927FE81_9BACT|nr:TonB-dependent receptor [Pelagicoccus enzymogenes]MBD5781773.1 TonB-dependent receptor [Pelagicoccus enzymogenes]
MSYRSYIKQTSFAAALLLAPLAFSQENDVVELDPYQVVADQNPGLADTDALTHLDQELIQSQQGTTAVDLFNYTAGVTGLNEGGRQAFRINVRGLEGSGRVAIDVDGALQNQIDHNHGSATTRVMVDGALLKSASVIRGPASSKKGGGSLAGSVSFRTIDPSDLLRGRATGGLLSGGYEQNGDGKHGTIASAIQANEKWSFLAALSAREFGNYENGEGEEVLASGSKSNSLLLKSEFESNDQQSLKLSFQNNEAEYEGSGAYARGQLRYGNTSAEDVSTKTLTANYSATSDAIEWLDLNANAYHTTNERMEERLDTGALTFHDIETYGFSLHNSSRLQPGQVSHNLNYGFDLFHDDLVSLEGEESLNSEASRDPGGTRQQAGLFLNTSHIVNPSLSLFSGLRYDDFEMSDNSGVELSGGNLSGRFGVEYSPFSRRDKLKDLTLFSSYGTGFRIPTLREAFLSSEPSTRRGQLSPGTKPNPNLDPETSETWELGIQRLVRGLFTNEDMLRARIAYYQQDILDLIGSVATDDPEYNTLSNVGSDSLEGIEFELRYSTPRYFLGATYDKRDREKVGTGLPGDPIQNQPWSAFLFAGLRLAENKLTIGAETKFSGAFEQDMTDQTNPTVVERMVRDSYQLVNLFASYQLNETTKVSARVDNLADKSYQVYQTLDTAMGRNAKIAFEYKF